MLNTTTKNKKKLAHREIIHKWRMKKAISLARNKLRAVHGSTGDEMMEDLLNGTYADEHNMFNPAKADYSISDGWDIVQEAYMHLLAMNKEGYWQLYDGEDITITMQKGKKKDVTLAQAVGYHIRHYIYNWGQSDFKKTYIEDYSTDDGEGNELNCYDVLSGLVEVTRLYDICDYEEWEVYKAMFSVVCEKCTARQKLIVHYRLQGYSVTDVAKKLNVRPCTISDHLKKIQAMVLKEFPEKLNNISEDKWKRIKR
jgi:predicted DNA-binding protein YlxM (UPF0122 family)